jgi:phage anti-repressor protein
MSSLARAATDVARIFMNNGYGVMADTAKQIAMLAKRGTGKQMKLRTLREFIVSARQAMEHAEKMIIEEDKQAHEGEGTAPG